ncbi:MAG: hypothetical protein Q9222_004726 [Ikaeria aurantiellina]
MDKAKAQELIAQFEQHHQGQMQCLQALFSLDPAETIQIEPEMKKKNTGKYSQADALQLYYAFQANENLATDESSRGSLRDAKTSATSAASYDNVPHGSPQSKIHRIPKYWALPWNNDSLRQRIEERGKDSSCGGGMRRGIPDVDSADPAARFITSNALKDLSDYAFEPRNSDSLHSEYFDGMAFYVIDFDPALSKTLDTRTCSGRNAEDPKWGEVLKTLFREVHCLTVPRKVKIEAN